MRIVKKAPIVTKVMYIATRAPHLSETHPPKGRSKDAGKMKVAVNRPALAKETPKLST